MQACPRHSCFAEIQFPWISEIRVWTVITVTRSFVLDKTREELLVISVSRRVGEDDLTEIREKGRSQERSRDNDGMLSDALLKAN